MTDLKRCDAQEAGYDGWFGIYCERIDGHAGPHVDGDIVWERVHDPQHFDEIQVDRLPLLRAALRPVIYAVSDGTRKRVGGSLSYPKWIDA